MAYFIFNEYSFIHSFRLNINQIENFFFDFFSSVNVVFVIMFLQFIDLADWFHPMQTNQGNSMAWK